MSVLPTADLEAVIAAAWQRLERASADRRHAFGRFQLGTIGAQGWPETRTVVLRGASRQARQIAFHTDRRSAKAGEIAADGRVSAVFWDRRASLQLRLWAQARLVTDETALDAAWTSLAPAQQAIYRADVHPGRPIEAPATLDTADAPGDRTAFALIELTVVRLDWLHLREAGHRRARFDWTGARWDGRWLVP